MRIQKFTCWAVALLAVAMLWGCGSSGGSGGSDVVASPDADTVQTLGVNNCLTCHEGGGDPFAPQVANSWANNIHGNANNSPGDLNDQFCLDCHDPLNDASLVGFTDGRAVVVGCEACHGGGSAHRGIGPLPYTRPGVEQCAQCHNADFPHGFAPEGVNIAEDFVASPHTNSLNEHVFAEEGSTDVRARCAKCHSNAGAKMFAEIDGDYDTLSSMLSNDELPVADPGAIDCATCHQAHQENELLEAATAGRSSEFNTCTNCHQLLDDDGNKIIAYHDPVANQYGVDEEIITDTHFATPGNFVSANTEDITGYAMDFSDERACRNCHNPHNADNTINHQWAASKHADTTAAGAWAHYNWTEVPGAVRNDGSVVPPWGDRSACQQCHSTSGIIAYLEANEDGDASDYTPPLDYNANYKPEMLHCNGCHSDSLGGLRDTSAITADYTDAPFTYPDADGSNICLACHTGRQSGDSIKNSAADFADTGFINSHYLTAGGTVYRASGYEYDVDADADTDNYANLPYFAHDLVGTAEEPGTGSGGPCIGCHLTSEESHSFQPVARDESTGLITAVTSDVCIACHDGGHGPAFVAEGGDAADVEAAAEVLNAEEEKFQASLDALAAQLSEIGFPYLGHYPYFDATDWTDGGAYDGQNLMGAAFNFNLLAHDPGAYAHNRNYAKKLIYDSLDYADNAAFDESVGAAIDALVTADALAATEASFAKAYLDGDSETDGVQRP